MKAIDTYVETVAPDEIDQGRFTREPLPDIIVAPPQQEVASVTETHWRNEDEDPIGVFTNAFKTGPAPKCEKHRHTPCGNRTIKDITAHARMRIADFLSIVRDGRERGVGIDEYVQLAEYLYGQFYISVDVICENGAMFLRDGMSADARALVKIGDDDVTDKIPQSNFSWERSSKSHELDHLWNLQHQGVGPVIHVTKDDVNGSCTFFCLIPIESLRKLNL